MPFPEFGVDFDVQQPQGILRGSFCILLIYRLLRVEQAFSLLLLGPFLDRYFSGDWVFTYNANFTNMTVLLLSCLAAVGVNISQFMCLGRFSAVSFQVSSSSPFRFRLNPKMT